MPDIDDLDFGSDEEVSQAHSALIKAVNQLDGGQRYCLQDIFYLCFLKQNIATKKNHFKLSVIIKFF